MTPVTFRPPPTPYSRAVLPCRRDDDAGRHLLGETKMQIQAYWKRIKIRWLRARIESRLALFETRRKRRHTWLSNMMRQS